MASDGGHKFSFRPPDLGRFCSLSPPTAISLADFQFPIKVTSGDPPQKQLQRRVTKISLCAH